MARKEGLHYEGTAYWQKINPRTGEVLEEKTVDEFTRETGRKEHFMITYLAEIIKLIDSLGNKKMKVVKYILKEMTKANNTLVITTPELARKSEVSYKTVIETLKILDNAGIIQRRTGAIMINPKLMNNKTKQGEAAMLIKFHQFEENQDNESDTRTDTTSTESKSV